MMLNRPAPVDAPRASLAQEFAALRREMRREFAALRRSIAQMNFMLGMLFAVDATTLGILIAKLYC